MTIALSAAMRLGAMVHPQAFGAIQRHGLSGEVVATCAMGAAVVASGVKENLYHVWPYLVTTRTCPACAMMNCGVGLIFHLNDTHFWSRERIADWIETWEAALTAARVEPGLVLVDA